MKKESNDHRVRITKLLIRRSFTDLLKTKPIQSISVKELSDRAGINRGTFLYSLPGYLCSIGRD